MLFYKCIKISLINFLNLPKKGAKRLFRLGSIMLFIFLRLIYQTAYSSSKNFFNLSTFFNPGASSKPLFKSIPYKQE